MRKLSTHPQAYILLTKNPVLLNGFDGSLQLNMWMRNLDYDAM